MHPSGFCIFAAPDDETGADDARDYIKRQGYTTDDVRMVRIEKTIVVKLKREMELRK